MDRGGAGRAVGRAVPRLERAHHRRVLPAQRLGAGRRRARPGRRRRQQLRAPELRRRADAALVARVAPPGRPRRGSSPRDAARGRRHRPGLQPLDPPAGERARRPDPDPVGARRLRPPLRTAGDGDVAPGDGGQRRRAARPGRGGCRGDDPGAGSGRRRCGRLGGGDDAWMAVDAATVETGVPHRWSAPDGRSIAIVFYDGPSEPRPRLRALGRVERGSRRPRAASAGADGTPVVLATDGETFGHHHKFADRALAYAFVHEAPANGVRTGTLAELLGRRAGDP